MMVTSENFQEHYKVHILKSTDCVKGFSCGDEDLDYFIKNEALAFGNALLALTYVVIDKASGHIVAYFSLATDKLSVADFNSNSEFNRFRKRRFEHEKRLRSYPAVKLCRLGVDNRLKGSGLGSFLLSFVTYYCTNGNRFGCRFLVVDAYKSAADFYGKNGFLKLKESKIESNVQLMYLDLKQTIVSR